MAERTLYQSAPVMRLYIAEHPFHYEMENLCRIFFPYHRIETIPCGTDGNGAHILDYGTLGAYTGMQTELGGIRLQARLFFGGRERTAEERTSLSFPGDLKELERAHGRLALWAAYTGLCIHAKVGNPHGGSPDQAVAQPRRGAWGRKRPCRASSRTGW